MAKPAKKFQDNSESLPNKLWQNLPNSLAATGRDESTLLMAFSSSSFTMGRMAFTFASVRIRKDEKKKPSDIPIKRGNIATKTTETFTDKMINISLIIKESLRYKIKVRQLLLYCKKKK